MGTPKRRYKIIIDADIDIKALMRFLSTVDNVTTVYDYQHKLEKE